MSINNPRFFGPHYYDFPFLALVFTDVPAETGDVRGDYQKTADFFSNKGKGAYTQLSIGLLGIEVPIFKIPR